jgi:hypothetical protein
MTEASAQKVATVVLGAAVAAAAYYVVRTPRLRKLAWRLVLTAVTVSIPAWLGNEVEQAWSASGRTTI